MKPFTKEILGGLTNVEWFRSVGKIIPDRPEFVILNSWEEAIKHYQSPDWERVQYTAKEIFWMEIASISAVRADEWNGLFDEISPIVCSLVDQKTAKVMAEQKLPADFVRNVIWDIRNVALEAEYFDIHRGGFYLLYVESVYASGHFPCGWIGKAPEGRPVVY